MTDPRLRVSAENLVDELREALERTLDREADAKAALAAEKAAHAKAKVEWKALADLLVEQRDAEKAAHWDLKRDYDAVYLLAQAHQATIATQSEKLAELRQAVRQWRYRSWSQAEELDRLRIALKASEDGHLIQNAQHISDVDALNAAEKVCEAAEAFMTFAYGDQLPFGEPKSNMTRLATDVHDALTTYHTTKEGA